MRIKRGQNKKRKHKAVLAETKGFRMTYSKLYRRAREGMLHAGQYSYAHRQHRRAQFRQDWIKIIAAGLYESGLSYSKFMSGLKKQQIELDRKVLAEMAQTNPEHFQQVVKLAGN